jgi:hypothetical protein
MEVALVGVVCATCVIGGVMIASGEEAASHLFHLQVVNSLR